MIIIDENKLRCSTITQIGEDYGMTYDMRDFDDNSYSEFIDSIVDRFYFDTDEFKERIIRIIKENLKVELKIVKEG